MKISELVKIVDATVYAPSNKDVEGEIMGAFASDMMSDVLAFAKNQDVLISGLCNPQTVRTAVMLDMKCILLVRGKIPTPRHDYACPAQTTSCFCPRCIKCIPPAVSFTKKGWAQANITNNELYPR